MKNPNIILVLIDDLGYGDVSCFNPQSKIPTPNLGGWPSRAGEFTDRHASSAVCFSLPVRPDDRAVQLALPSEAYRAGGHRPPPDRGWAADHRRAAAPGGLPHRRRANGTWAWTGRRPTPTLCSTTTCSTRSPPARLGADYDKPIQNGPTAKGFDYFFGLTASLDRPPCVHRERPAPPATPQDPGGRRLQPLLPRLLSKGGPGPTGGGL